VRRTTSVAFLGLLALAAAPAKVPTFHPMSIVQLTSNAPGAWRNARTHAELEGYVTYKKREDDGDLHIRACDSPKITTMDRHRCVVFECIPALPCTEPPLGALIRADVITRYDGEHGHGWWEGHPVLSLTVIK
jgi:hypothetical protein